VYSVSDCDSTESCALSGKVVRKVKTTRSGRWIAINYSGRVRSRMKYDTRSRVSAFRRRDPNSEKCGAKHHTLWGLTHGKTAPFAQSQGKDSSASFLGSCIYSALKSEIFPTSQVMLLREDFRRWLKCCLLFSVGKRLLRDSMVGTGASVLTSSFLKGSVRFEALAQKISFSMWQSAPGYMRRTSYLPRRVK